MGLIFPEEMYLFSGLKGTLTYEGKPQANVKLKLYIMDPNRDEEEHFYTTDENGFFEIPDIKKKVRTVPFQQVVVNAKIYAYYNDTEQRVWYSGRHDGDKWEELGGDPLDMVCELTEKEIRLTTPSHSTVVTMCRWTKFYFNPDIPDFMFRGFTDHFTPKVSKKKRILNNESKQQ